MSIINSKGQFKIQEMAFVVVMVMIFFGLGSLIFLVIIGDNLSDKVSLQRADEAKEMVRKIAVSPELSFVDGCDSCIDVDKAMIIKYNDNYEDYWDLEYLRISVLYPEKSGECTKSNYPNCQSITLIGENETNYGITESAFVSLCRYDPSVFDDYKCELGKIFASGRALNRTR